MKISELRKLINAGLSDQQILALNNEGKQKPDEKGKPAQTPDKFDKVLEAINKLTETIQASNINGAENPEPETVDDILESLIIED